MDAYEFLSQVYLIQKRIDSKYDQITILKSLAERITSSFSQVPGGGTPEGDRIQNAVVEIARLQEELLEEVESFLHAWKQVKAVINKVRNEKYRLVLEKRYLCTMSWERIANEMEITSRWVQSLGNQSLRVVQKILDAQK